MIVILTHCYCKVNSILFKWFWSYTYKQTHNIRIMSLEAAFKEGVKTNHAIPFLKVNPIFLATLLQCFNAISSDIRTSFVIYIYLTLTF